ncbi:hypothetical protein [Amycolatopsis nalaikhensis]|uniref:Secreted protein n=1 Tax=Amycolatopsis nalaikhensis TaxID=715472 RepID=A0ABY8XAP1_9PSEU|nr:hypothetical protein [Amycolatopsis sp. 2-2]WIV52985.1 hypothetical protein QP939_29080 [Amycolatopsis sp. 2-2]
MAGTALAEQATPSAYGYVAGTSGSIFGKFPSGANLLSAAAPTAPESDPGARISSNSATSIPAFTIDGLPIGIEAGGGAGVLAVDTNANLTTGVSAAKVSGVTARIGARLTVEKLVDSIYGSVSSDSVKTVLRMLRAGFPDASAEATLSFTGLESSCQAGPVGSPATGGASLTNGGLRIAVPGWTPVDISFESILKGNRFLDLLFGQITAATNVVDSLPDGGVSVDAVSLRVAGKTFNLGHVECHPGVAADGQ